MNASRTEISARPTKSTLLKDVIRASKIKIYLRLAEKIGIGQEALLAGTDIHPGVLSDPGNLISRQMYYDVILNLLKLSENPAIAFSLADVEDISDYGIAGYAMLSATTVRQTLAIHRQYMNSLLISPISIDYAGNTPSGGYELVVSSQTVIETFRRFEIEEFFVTGLRFMRILVGQDPTVVNMRFAYPEPTHAAAYKSFFQCPIEFNARETRLEAVGVNYDTAIPTRDLEHHSACLQHCEKVMQSLPDSGRLRLRLRELFLANPGELPGLNIAASNLGMSERHMRRKLLVEGLSYRVLKEEFRFDLSRQLLVSGHMVPKAVAHFLGYATPSGFCRAFKGWSGQTVGQFLQTNNEQERQTPATGEQRHRAFARAPYQSLLDAGRLAAVEDAEHASSH